MAVQSSPVESSLCWIQLPVQWSPPLCLETVGSPVESRREEDGGVQGVVVGG